MNRWTISALATVCLAFQAVAQETVSPLPKGTVGFVRVNAQALAASPLVDQYKKILQSADKEVADAFLKRLPVDPASVVSLTGILWQPKPRLEPLAVFVADFKTPVDLAGLAKALGTRTPVKTPAGELTSGGGFAVLSRSGKSIVAGHPDMVMAFASAPKVAVPAWAEVWNRSADGVASAWLTTDLSVLPPEVEANIKRSAWVYLQPLRGSQVAGLSLSMDAKDAVARATVVYNDAAAAKASVENWKLTTELVRGLLKGGEGIAALTPLVASFFDSELAANFFGAQNRESAELLKSPLVTASFAYLAGYLAEQGELLAKAPFEANGNAVSVSGKISPAGLQSGLGVSGVLAGLMLPAVQSARAAGQRMQGVNNLKQIGLALLTYYEVNKHFPPAVVRDKTGKPLYSWRVLILPYIEQGNIYKKWKLDEPWDSPNNKPLSDLVVKVFAAPGSPDENSNKTHYRVFVGKGAGFEETMGQQPKGQLFAGITDGSSNTISVVEATQSVPWAKPEELEFIPGKPLPALGLPGKDGFNAALFDGTVRFIRKTIDPRNLQALITRNGGEEIGVLD